MIQKRSRPFSAQRRSLLQFTIEFYVGRRDFDIKTDGTLFQLMEADKHKSSSLSVLPGADGKI
jgi:hypothetical protein